MEVDGDLVRGWRTGRGLTLLEMADITGLSERTLRTVERGGPASGATIRQIAKETGIDYSELVRQPPNDAGPALLRAGLLPSFSIAPGPDRPEQEEIVEFLKRKPDRSTYCITGVSGVGKTWAARRIFDAVKDRFPGGALWIPGESITTENGRVALQRRIAEALGFAERIPDASLVGVPAFHAAFASEFWSQRRLIVLDDLPNSRVLRHFLGNKPHTVLVTSRYRLVADTFAPHVWSFNGLTSEQSRSLLRHYLDDGRLGSEPEALERLVELTGGIPRALHIAGRILAREAYVPIVQFVEHVRKEPNALLPAASEADERDLWSRDEASELARHSRLDVHLSPEAREFHSCLAPFGRRSFSTRWASIAGDVDLFTARRLISELTNVFLLRENRGPDVGDVENLHFELDRHSHLAARARSPRIVQESERRIISEAARQLLGSEAIDDDSLIESFQRDPGAWRAALRAWAAPIVGAWRPNGLPTPSSIPSAAGEPVVEGFAHAALRILDILETHWEPDMDRWLVGGLAEAARTHDTDVYNDLAAIAALRSGTRLLDRKGIEAWLDVITPGFAQSGHMGLATLACHWRARIQAEPGRWSEAADALEPLENEPFEGLQPTSRANYENDRAVVDVMLGNTEDAIQRWRSAESLVEGGDVGHKQMRLLFEFNSKAAQYAHGEISAAGLIPPALALVDESASSSPLQAMLQATTALAQSDESAYAAGREIWLSYVRDTPAERAHLATVWTSLLVRALRGEPSGDNPVCVQWLLRPVAGHAISGGHAPSGLLGRIVPSILVPQRALASLVTPAAAQHMARLLERHVGPNAADLRSLQELTNS